jgi:thiol-disulfide isomerase/thioredoxin
MNKILFLLLFAFCTSVSFSQVNINFTINGNTSDTVYFGKIAGKKQKRQLPILKNSDGTFTYSSATELEPGFYGIFYDYTNKSNSKNNYYFQFAIDEKNKNYSIVCDALTPTYKLKVIGEGSETTRYYEYLNTIDSISTAYSNAIDQYNRVSTEANFVKLELQEKNLKAFQLAYLQKYPGTLTSKFIGLTRFDFPLYIGSFEERKKQRQDFYTNEYVKSFDPTASLLWMSKNGIDWLDFYTIKSADKNVDNAAVRSIKILNILYEKNRPIFNYYLNYMMNSFPKMTKHGMDLVTIAISKEYFESGKETIYTADELQRFKSQIENILRLKAGNKIPDVKLYKEDDSPVNIYDIKTKYALITFWSPDCGHCKKELPILKTIGEKYKSKGLTIVTVCAKKADKTASCYEYLNQQKFPSDWINLNDKNNLSRFNSIYDITSFPCIYLFNTATKEIILRRKGEMELDELEYLFDGLE